MVIQHYEASTGTFAQPVSYKVKKLLELELIKKIADGVYQVLPIPGYNITPYTIREQIGRLACNCQGYRKYNRCSHSEAVRIYRERTETKEQQQHFF